MYCNILAILLIREPLSEEEADKLICSLEDEIEIAGIANVAFTICETLNYSPDIFSSETVKAALYRCCLSKKK